MCYVMLVIVEYRDGKVVVVAYNCYDIGFLLVYLFDSRLLA